MIKLDLHTAESIKAVDEMRPNSSTSMIAIAYSSVVPKIGEEISYYDVSGNHKELNGTHKITRVIHNFGFEGVMLVIDAKPKSQVIEDPEIRSYK